MKELNKNIKLLIILLPIVIIFCFGSIAGCFSNSLNLSIKNTLGVWWWHKADANTYLDFAKENGVDEIYYCDYTLNEETANFVKKAKNKGMKVYALWGEKEWIFDKNGYDKLIEKYNTYQNTNINYRLEGIHLDVEPQQYFNNATSENEKTEYLKRYVEFVDYATQNKNIKIDFDIAFWFDNIITYNNETKEAYKFVIDYANRVFVMSYRDSAEKIYNVGKDECEYAKTINKDIFLSVETKKIEETPQITFYEEGKHFMCDELKKLTEQNKDIGISVHHIESWKELKK